jgi:protein gp37
VNKTKIEWADYTWNPVTGCNHGCPYCYARRIAERFKGKAFPNGFEPTFCPERLIELKKIKKPSWIFAVRMGDLFGEWVPDEWIRAVFKVCEGVPEHQYIFLTKNPKRFGVINGHWYNYQCDWPKNSWLGTSITNQSDAKRIRQLPYRDANTFISIEPLQESIDLSFYLPKQGTKCHCSICGHYATNYSEHCQNCGKKGGYSGSFRKQSVNWIIVGAQTGPGAKQPKAEWVQEIIDQAREHSIPIFLKDNLNWPEKIQEFPEVAPCK